MLGVLSASDSLYTGDVSVTGSWIWKVACVLQIFTVNEESSLYLMVSQIQK